MYEPADHVKALLSKKTNISAIARQFYRGQLFFVVLPESIFSRLKHARILIDKGFDIYGRVSHRECEWRSRRAYTCYDITELARIQSDAQALRVMWLYLSRRSSLNEGRDGSDVTCSHLGEQRHCIGFSHLLLSQWLR